MFHRIKYGWTYNVAPRIKVNQIKQALLVLANSSLGGYLYLSGNKNPVRIYMLKNQDHSEWWFELLLKRKHENIFGYLKSKLPNVEILGGVNPEIINKSFKDYYRIVVGSNYDEISVSLMNLFMEHLGCSLESKIFLKFYKIEVEKAISLE